MYSFHHITIYCLIIALTASCGQKNSAPQYAQHKDSPFNGRGPLLNFDDTDTILLPDDEPYIFEKYGTIDFFGVRLSGPIETILYAIDSIPFIKVDIQEDIRFRHLHSETGGWTFYMCR